jgi:glycosyltransferase involved in cell wall biosynthesis
LVAGRGVDIEYENQIRAICKSDDRIICETGYIPDNRVELYFKSADCAVLPYKNIYTSGVAMLALTFKIPIITRKTPFSEEYLNEYNSILIDGADEDSIKEGMTKYILNMEKLIVTEDFKAKYEWKTIVKKLLEDDRVRSVFFK